MLWELTRFAMVVPMEIPVKGRSVSRVRPSAAPSAERAPLSIAAVGPAIESCPDASATTQIQVLESLQQKSLRTRVSQGKNNTHAPRSRVTAGVTIVAGMRTRSIPTVAHTSVPAATTISRLSILRFFATVGSKSPFAEVNERQERTAMRTVAARMLSVECDWLLSDSYKGEKVVLSVCWRLTN
jgi:hypothetical protein